VVAARAIRFTARALPEKSHCATKNIAKV
jgi:hypothetical protein